jgi:hypothetical protein
MEVARRWNGARSGYQVPFSIVGVVLRNITHGSGSETPLRTTGRIQSVESCCYEATHDMNHTARCHSHSMSNTGISIACGPGGASPQPSLCNKVS